MKILVINCGSSSAKYELFDIKNFKNVAKGVVERIKRLEDYRKAIEAIKKRLLDAGRNIINSVGEIDGIGHRVVHGGERFKKSAIITDSIISEIEKFNKFAPLHNPPSLEGIKACFKYFPGIPQVAVFDTSFHQTMPDYSYIYGIPYELYKRYGIRRYGFHGTSHRFVANEAAKILKKSINRLRIVTVHLGNGCSMACVSRGKSIDTTMGFTPLEGLLMGTRSGDLDPAIVTFLMEALKLNPREMNDFLNKKSGLLGVSGVSNDMRDMLGEVKKGNYRAKLAYNIFIYRIKKYIGAYAAAMGGLDAVVFTAGIGENVPEIKNRLKKDIGNAFGKNVRFLTIPTNEELLIAQDTYNLVKQSLLPN